MSRTQQYLPNCDHGHFSFTDRILTTMTNSSISVWGFVLVRCSYADESKWEAFLAEIKEQTLVRSHELGKASLDSRNRLNERLRWTVIEDREELEGASMQIASVRFNEWVKSAGREELNDYDTAFLIENCFPRYKVFLYIDADTLEIVTEGSPRFHQAGHGYQPMLVRADLNLRVHDPEEWAREANWPFEEEADDSYYRTNTRWLVGDFASFLDINDWYYGWETAQSRAAP